MGIIRDIRDNRKALVATSVLGLIILGVIGISIANTQQSIREREEYHRTMEETNAILERAPVQECFDDLVYGLDTLSYDSSAAARIWGIYDDRLQFVDHTYQVYQSEVYSVGEEQAMARVVDAVLAVCEGQFRQFYERDYS